MSEQPSKPWLRRGLVLLILAVAGLWLARGYLAPKPLVVSVEPASIGRVEEIATNSRAGTIEAHRRARLSPEVGGQVVEIPFREGERVEQNAVILRLAPSSQAARVRLSDRELDAARAEQQRACLAAERAQRELENTRRLTEDLILPSDRLDQADSAFQVAQATCETASANVARARAAIMLSQAELDKTEIRAPFSGIVAELTTEVGEWATPSPPALPVPPVIEVFDPQSIYVSAQMDEVDSAKLRVGQKARVTIDSHRDETFSGTVSRKAPYVVDIEQQNRTVEIDVEIDDRQLAETLLPGTSADVEIVLESRDDVLRIPTRALIEGKRVLTLTAGRLEERQVEIGLRNWQFTEIVSGLERNDQLVTSLDRPDLEPGAEATVADSVEDSP